MNEAMRADSIAHELTIDIMFAEADKLKHSKSADPKRFRPRSHSWDSGI